MISENKICFGYGDIIVSNNVFDTIYFQEMNKPTSIGTNFRSIPSDVTINKVVSISFADNIDLLFRIERWLNLLLVNENIEKTVKVKDYEISFEKYNKESINIVLKHVKIIADNAVRLMAC